MKLFIVQVLSNDGLGFALVDALDDSNALSLVKKYFGRDFDKCYGIMEVQNILESFEHVKIVLYENSDMPEICI